MKPLWTPENETTESSAFHVHYGDTIMLVGTGFQRYRTRSSVTDSWSPQAACVNRLIFDYDSYDQAVEPHAPCDCLLDLDNIQVETIEEPVMIDGKPWQITACNNTILISLPGIYRLHLNDQEAVGTAQVWLEVLKPHRHWFPPEANMYLKGGPCNVGLRRD